MLALPNDDASRVNILSQGPTCVGILARFWCVNQKAARSREGRTQPRHSQGFPRRRGKYPRGRTRTCGLEVGGALGRTRTCGQLLRRQLLYPLSYEGVPTPTLASGVSLL
jgi:hypothetical protein